MISRRAGQCGSGRNRSHRPRPAPKRQPPGEATFLISHFERNTKSCDPFGVPEMVQAGGSESIRDDAFRLPPASRSSGRVKRLLKIADQMKPGLERDQPFARMIDAVPIGFALFAAPSRSGPNPDTDPPRSSRSRCHVRSIRLAEALSDKRIRIDRTPDGNFAAC